MKLIQKKQLIHYYFADKARTSKSTGLGLSIAKEILQHMNETITVQSEPGKGTIFTIVLAKNMLNQK